MATRLVDRPAVTRVRGALAAYWEAGGALLAEGLAYAALFALLPAFLLLAGVTGLVLQDPARRAAAVGGLAGLIPPLRTLISEALDAVSGGAFSFSVVGLLGLTWGASRFYAALDDAFSLVFVGERRRGLVARTLLGVATVVLLVVAFVGAVALGSVASFLEGALAFGGLGPLASAGRLLSPVAAALVAAGAVTLAYRVLPTRRLPWRIIAPVGLAVGVALAVFTGLFTLLAPRLIGSASVYGTFVAVFAALVWLSLSFQALLVGAAWLATGEERGRPAR